MNKYPTDNSFLFFIGFLFGNSTNQNRTFIHTSVKDAGDSTFNQNLRQLTMFLFIAII
jgi:hypothetical protein